MMDWLDKQPVMMTVDEVAELFHVSPKTVRRMVKDGRLPAITFGRSWRISREAIRTFLVDNRVETDPW
jgi:excisionase family DNA binding protein